MRSRQKDQAVFGDSSSATVINVCPSSLIGTAWGPWSHWIYDAYGMTAPFVEHSELAVPMSINAISSPSHIILAQPWTEKLLVYFRISRSLLLVNGFVQHIAVSLDVACKRLIMNHCFAWAWFFELLSEITLLFLLSSLKAQHCSKLSSLWPSCLQSSASICTSQGLSSLDAKVFRLQYVFLLLCPFWRSCCGGQDVGAGSLEPSINHSLIWHLDSISPGLPSILESNAWIFSGHQDFRTVS